MIEPRKRWHEVLDRIPVDREFVGAEVGVWRGNLSEQILAGRPLLTLHLVDPWTAASQGRNLTGRCHPSKAKAKVEGICTRFGGRGVIHQGFSVDVAAKLPDHSLDFVYIDAKHSYEAVRQDIRAWRNKVKSGGWIGGHDYGPGPDGIERFPGVRQAVTEAFGEVELGEDFCWFVEVNPERKNVRAMHVERSRFEVGEQGFGKPIPQ